MSAEYIRSNENRHYIAKEEVPGDVPAINATNRVNLSALRLTTTHVVPRRNDKLGTRSAGEPLSLLQKESSFQFSTYHYINDEYPGAPRSGSLIEAALGANAIHFAGATVDSIPAPSQIRFVAPHNLMKRMAVSFGGEIRFVSKVIDASTVELNAAFSISPTTGQTLPPTATYTLSRSVQSLSLFDYWSPASSVQRVCRGATVDKLVIDINGDYHTLTYAGPAVEVLDNLSFEPGQGGLAAFLSEPPDLENAHPMPVPGHLGQAYIGANRYFTITDASVTLHNGVDTKGREFGSTIPRCFVPGRRTVLFSASLYATDEEATRSLYEEAVSRNPVPVMLQLGDRAGQLMGVYMPSVVPNMPSMDDRENRLLWRFDKCSAHGTQDDELCIGMA